MAAHLVMGSVYAFRENVLVIWAAEETHAKNAYSAKWAVEQVLVTTGSAFARPHTRVARVTNVQTVV